MILTSIFDRKQGKMVDELMLSVDMGKGTCDDRQVSVMLDSVRKQIQAREVQGLCMRKFKPDLVVADLTLKDLKVGDRISVGDADLEVTWIGKRCFGDICKIFDSENQCEMVNGVFFLKVLKSGNITKNNDILSI